MSWLSVGEGRQSETEDSFILLYFLWSKNKRWRNQFQKGCSSLSFFACVTIKFCVCVHKKDLVFQVIDVGILVLMS